MKSKILSILLIQLPVPQHNYQKQTGNIPLAAGYLKQSLAGFTNVQIMILPEKITAYYSDLALINHIEQLKPDLIGFTVYCWNLFRTKHIHDVLKQRFSFISVVGGPEINKDNPLLNETSFDYQIYGEGEISFCQLVEKLSQQTVSCIKIEDLISPYLLGDIDCSIENTMFLETQRGCPYHCNFCFYNKDRKKILQFDRTKVLKAIDYAYHHPEIDQVYLMDPALNSRQDLHDLLCDIKKINKNNKLKFYSEIRAESINEQNIDLFSESGFIEFEVGLQTINPIALKLMNRNHDLIQFTKSCKLMLKNNITPKIDLIIGLPGDNLNGFIDSCDYLYEHELDESLQIFALSLLPGTQFRKDYNKFQIEFQTKPPYNILSNMGFNHSDIKKAFQIAEKKFNLKLFPKPYPDMAYLSSHKITAGYELYSKIILYDSLSDQEISTLSSQLTNPYQVFIINPLISCDDIKKTINCFTSNNPHTSLELIFFHFKDIKAIEQIILSSNLSENSYLENDLLYSQDGVMCRSIWISLINKTKISFKSEYQIRNFYLWDSETLPTIKDLLKYDEFDGIIIDNLLETNKLYEWQDNFLMSIECEENQDLLHFVNGLPETLISFADFDAQQRWKELNFKDDFCFTIQNNFYLKRG